MRKRLLFVVNVDWFFLSHRLPIATAAIHEGYEVHIAVAITDHLVELQSHGLAVHPLRMRRGLVGKMAELAMLVELILLFRRLKPDLVHLVTIRPVIFGGIAARLTGVSSIVAAISGLGFVFVAKGMRARARRLVVGTLYSLALRTKRLKVIFQNEHDQNSLSRIAHLRREQSELIRGSGVDLTEYMPELLPPEPPVILMACRLIKDKGVWEFVEAARLLKQRAIPCRFCLVGGIDPDNPTSLTEDQLDAIKREGIVELWGVRSDMPAVLSEAHIVALPSYYGEGLPKILIEAAACGRAIVTTDMPGCRDAVIPGQSGLLVPPRDAIALAGAIERLISDRKTCVEMGRVGRELAKREFDIANVVSRHMEIYKELLGNSD